MRTSHRFDVLFDDLARTRNRYELLRISGDSLDERSHLLTRLQALRAEIARERAAGIR